MCPSTKYSSSSDLFAMAVSLIRSVPGLLLCSQREIQMNRSGCTLKIFKCSTSIKTPETKEEQKGIIIESEAFKGFLLTSTSPQVPRKEPVQGFSSPQGAHMALSDVTRFQSVCQT